ncbi:MAG TPA: hypothetical protein VEQ65_09825 [Opitutus sp.]|nr:hypothetical protein [Opitutus sp.]
MIEQGPTDGAQRRGERPRSGLRHPSDFLVSLPDLGSSGVRSSLSGFDFTGEPRSRENGVRQLCAKHFDLVTRLLNLGVLVVRLRDHQGFLGVSVIDRAVQAGNGSLGGGEFKLQSGDLCFTGRYQLAAKRDRLLLGPQSKGEIPFCEEDILGVGWRKVDEEWTSVLPNCIVKVDVVIGICAEVEIFSSELYRAGSETLGQIGIGEDERTAFCNAVGRASVEQQRVPAVLHFVRDVRARNNRGPA